MAKNTSRNERAFALSSTHVYVPGSLPKEVDAEAPRSSGGGCCGSAPVQHEEQSAGCGTSGCGTGSTGKQSSRCC